LIVIGQFVTLTASSTTATAHCRVRIVQTTNKARLKISSFLLHPIFFIDLSKNANVYSFRFKM